MREIKTTQGFSAMVDNEDFDSLSAYKWHVNVGSDTMYAVCTERKNGIRTSIKMHRLILGLKNSEICDHIDGNGLNNQKENLRIATKSQNNANKRATGLSKYLGVSLHKGSNKWRGQIKKNRKITHLGYFTEEEDAAQAYNTAATRIHGEFARLNVVKPLYGKVE